MIDCKCEIDWDENMGYFIIHCPLHAAAPELLEACRGLLAIADRYTGVGLREIAMARAAIKAAGGE